MASPLHHDVPPASALDSSVNDEADGAGLAALQDADAAVNPLATGDSLADLVTCAICIELLYHPITLGCLHTFCGDELLEWIRKHGKCPSCRSKVKSINEGFPSQALLDYFLALHPGRARILSDQEREAKETIYKPGVTSLKRELRDCLLLHEGDDFSTDYDGEDDFDFDAERDNGAMDDGDLVGRIFHAAADHHQVYEPCLFCDPQNTLGFVCPEPSPPNFRPVSVFARPPDPGQKHTVCRECNRLIPVREDDNPCWNCKQRICPAGTGCNADGTLVFHILDYRSGSDITPWELLQFGGDWYHVAQCLVTTPPSAIDLRERLNGHEASILAEYVRETAITPGDIFRDMLGRSDNANDLFAMTAPLQDDDRACRECFYGVLRGHIATWWYSKRADVEDDLPAEVTRRPKCWYGNECRTQWHNPLHAERYHHACSPVPLDQRHDIRDQSNA